MSNAIVASTSTLSGGVLTVTFKVSAGAAPSSDFGLNLFFDATKVASSSVSGPLNWSTASNTTVPGEIRVAAFEPNGTGTIAPNDVAVTVRFTLASTADTTLNFSYSGNYNTPPVAIPTTAVQAGNNFLSSPATGLPTITGTVTEDQVLTANTSGIHDGDGMGTPAFQWLRDGTAITGATSATHTLGDADVGKSMTVRVSFTDGNGNAESRTSTATANVVNVNDVPTGTVTTSGAAVVGATLTAANTLADNDGMGTVAYQWNSNGTPLSGATGPTLAVTDAHLGTTLSVTATYVDAKSTTETRTSASTAAVGPNSAPTGTVTIAGTPAEGQTLTASNTLADADGMATAVTYQWSANGTPISGATGSTLVLTQGQVSQTITVRGSYTDSLGAVQGMTSAATTGVANVDQAPTGTVTITGTAAEDQTLTAANTLADVDGMGTVSYQWAANGVNISGATGPTVLLTQAEVGKTVMVKATYTDLQGTTHNVSSGATAVVANVNDLPTGSVTFTGSAIQGQTLTAANSLADEDGMGTVSYQWLSNGTAIAGATGSTLVLGQAQVGTAVSVRGTYVDLQNTTESATSTASTSVGNINDAPTGAITASGVTSVNQTLTATSTLVDPDGLGTFSYQWIRDTTDVAGATGTGQTYALTSADLGARMSVRVNYTDGFGQAETSTSAQSAVIVPNTPPGGSVTVTGTMAQNQLLTVSNNLTDADNGVGTVSYQWLADGVAISGGTGTTFTLTEAQVNKVVTARASYTDGLGTPETKDSVSSTPVANVNDPNTGTVSIAGTAAQNQVLTATATLADIDGMGTVGFQWLADGVAISGATGSTITLAQAQVDKLISVRASFTDGHGTVEQRSSVSTSRVTNVNDVATGMPVIVGLPTQGVTLGVNSSSIADVDGLGNLNYQWLADGAAIAGAINSTLALTQAQVGKAVSVRTFFTDGFGKVESLDSASSSPVANVNDAATGSVVIDGSAVVGMPLTATPTLADIDGLGTFSYQWLVAGVVIAGATAKTFAPTSAQAGKAVSVKVSFTDAFGTAESVTSLTVNVASEDDVTPLAAPGIAPTVGDGNGDGLRDATQIQVVSVPFSKIGSNGVTENSFITLVVDSSSTGTVNNGSTAVITSIDQQDIPTTGTGKAPPKMTTPLGLIDFTATVATGQTETFTLFADRSLNINGYWKQDASGKWVNLASAPYGGATTPVGNKMRLDFKITDGGEFDNDHVANGVIADPGAIAAMPLSLVGYAPDVTLTASTHFFF